jgi:hypothetical protein
MCEMPKRKAGPPATLVVMGGANVTNAGGTAIGAGAQATTWIEATSPGITEEVTNFVSGLSTPQYTPGLAGALGFCASMESCINSISASDGELYLAY